MLPTWLSRGLRFDLAQVKVRRKRKGFKTCTTHTFKSPVLPIKICRKDIFSHMHHTNCKTKALACRRNQLIFDLSLGISGPSGQRCQRFGHFFQVPKGCRACLLDLSEWNVSEVSVRLKKKLQKGFKEKR